MWQSFVCSSSSVILLLIPSSVLFISVSLFFSSRSLVNISYIFSILFPKSWIIFTIIILNYFPGMLPISTSFSGFFGGVDFILSLNLEQNPLLFHFDSFSVMWILFRRSGDCSSCFISMPSGKSG